MTEAKRVDDFVPPEHWGEIALPNEIDPVVMVSATDYKAKLRELQAQRKIVGKLVGALMNIRSGMTLMVPEPQQSAFLKIIDAALKETENGE